MLCLSLDLSAPHASIALVRDGEASERAVGDQYQHTERLLTVLQGLLESSNTKLSEIDRYLTVEGPGSFTGLRIAMATLKAFAQVYERPIDTLSAAEVRALAWQAERKAVVGTSVRVLTHVSSGKLVVSHFTTTAQGVAAVSEKVEGGVTVGPEEIVLNDARVPRALIQGGHVEDFLLKARYLAEQAPRAKSRKTFATLGDWIAMSPAYFGAQHYE